MHNQLDSWHSSDSLPTGSTQHDLDTMHEYDDDFINQEPALSFTPKVTKLDEDWRKVKINKVEETGEEKFNRAMDELQMTIDSCMHTIESNSEIVKNTLQKIVELVKNK